VPTTSVRDDTGRPCVSRVLPIGSCTEYGSSVRLSCQIATSLPPSASTSEKYWWPRPPDWSTFIGADQVWPLSTDRTTYATERPTRPELASAELYELVLGTTVVG
jgi:hypothetical protein